MATDSITCELAAQYLKNYNDFKIDFGNKIDWKRAEWEAEGLVKSKIYYTIKNTGFWFKNLKEVEDPKTLVFTLFNEGSDTLVNPKDIMLSFKKQFGVAGLKGFSITRNRYFFALFFDTIEQRNLAANGFVLFEDKYIINSDWHNDRKPAEFKIIWLPPTIDLIDIQQRLEEFCSVVTLVRETMDLGDSDILPTGAIMGKCFPKQNTSLQDIPYILNFSGFNGLLIIFKRQPLCLNCHSIGHIAARCPTPFCTTCRTLKNKQHTCNSKGHIMSYAEVTVNSLADESFLWNKKLVQSMDSLNVLKNLQKEIQLQQVLNAEEYKIINHSQDISQVQSKDYKQVPVKEVDSLNEKGSEQQFDSYMEVQTASNKRTFEQIADKNSTQNTKTSISKNTSDSKKSNKALKAKEGIENGSKLVLKK